MREQTFRRVTGALTILGGVVVFWLATSVFPYHSLNHDEAVYLQQAAMLLEGQLVLNPPLEDVFRPWFFVEAGDTLYPKYAPVPAVLFAVGKLLGGYRLALAGIAAGNLTLVALVGREVFDRRTGVLAAILMLASPLFLLDSAVFLPYAPTTLLNLAFAYGYLRADRTGDRRWAAFAGAAVGLAFFSRPYTAVLFATPFIAHALWTLSQDFHSALSRQTVTAVLGLAGVALALAYNTVLTGSPLVFPYQAFAPLDGLGFGRRRILNHEIMYTVELALRANARVVTAFFTDWLAGGLLGTALAVFGFGSVFLSRERHPDARQIALAGVALSVVVGNVYFWGNYNILGVLEDPGDGLISFLGPYYHFDLLVPTVIFGAVGVQRGAHVVHELITWRLTTDAARVGVALVLLVGAGAFGAVTAADVDDRVDRNLDVTETYADAYEPFADGAPTDAVVLVPEPYGPWLNHPFQLLRNDPGFDGPTIYTLNDRPFAVADTYPNRTLYRYGYQGVWAPTEGSPDAARLQRVRDVAGTVVTMNATMGVPDGAVGVTARVSTDDGSAYYVAKNASHSLNVSLDVRDGHVTVTGDVVPVGNELLAVSGRDVVRMTVFMDYGAGDGAEYRFALPVDAHNGSVRALSPRLEWCRDARACGGASVYVPDTAPDGVSVEVSLTASEHNA